MITRNIIIIIIVTIILTASCKTFHGKNENINTDTIRRLKRQALLINLDEISQNSIEDEVTSTGMIIRGGADLPPGFSGSGSSDFAFSGESFRPAHIPLFRPFRPQLATNANTNGARPNQQINIQTSSPPLMGSSTQAGDTPANVPNACQKECHKRTTGEYNPMCGSDGVTYFNPSKFRCALQCGRRITGRPNVGCGLGTPVI